MAERRTFEEEEAISKGIKERAQHVNVHEIDAPITEEWLYAAGFRWTQRDRQNSRHWLLWLGWAVEDKNTCLEDLGLELAPVLSKFSPDEWFCWIRSDFAGRYSRFLHVRHLKTRREVVLLLNGLVGDEWRPENAFYGRLLTPARAEREREDAKRFDRELVTRGHPHSPVERDETRAGANADTLDQQAKYRTGETDL